MSMDISYKKITQIVNLAIERFLQNDLGLLYDDVHERTISSKIAMYLQPHFNGYNVDPEYNREGHRIKTLNGEKIYPDIIVHIRNKKVNLLIMEIKKDIHPEKLINKDRNRLKKMTINQKYQYRLGVLIIFCVKNTHNNQPIIEYYKNGEQLTL